MLWNWDCELQVLDRALGRIRFPGRVMSHTCDSDANERHEVLCKDSRDIEDLPATKERSPCSAVGLDIS